MDRVILHCDLNNFYASVEMATNKELGGLPVVVCGNPENRHGIVLAKNQLAKNCGIKTGDTIYEAKIKCPNVETVPPHYEKYVYYSNEVFKIYQRFTDRIEHFGIDECWLDVTASTKLFGSGKQIADKLREIVKNELNLTISVGVSFTKSFAKLGSDYKKPDATTVISRENFKQIAWNLPASDLLMVGRRTTKKLNEMNIFTIGDLAHADHKIMREKFGIVGVNLVNTALGIENEPVKLASEVVLPKSVSNGTTTKNDMTTLDDAKTVIYALCDLIAYRLRGLNLSCTGVGINYKYNNFIASGKNKRTPYPTDSSTDIANYAIDLLTEDVDFSTPLRAISICTYNLIENKDGIQVSIESKDRNKKHNMDKAIDKIKSKYGYNSIVRGVILNSDINENLHSEDGFKPFQR